MVKFIKGKDCVLVSIQSREKFQDIVDLCKTYKGKFKDTSFTETDDLVMKVWEISFHAIADFAKSIQNIGEADVPDFVLNYTSENDDDFKRFRTFIDKECVKSEWKGDYQRNAVLKGISQNRLALFHEMGLGKSFEIQTILNHLVKRNRIDAYVIVSPPEGVINIANECVKFSSFGLTWDDISIVDTENRNPFENPKKVTVMTYRNLLMLHQDFYKKRMGKKAPDRIIKNYIPWNMLGNNLAIVLDESPAIKSRTSKTYKLADKSKDYFEYRFLMSGTPAPKYAEDLWTQFRFLQQSSVPNDYGLFISSIANVGSRFSSTDVNFYYPEKVQDFLDRTSYLVDRVRAEGNIELPDLIIEPILCKLPPKQADLYKKVVLHTINSIKEQNGVLTKRALKNKYPFLSLVLHDPIVLAKGHLGKGTLSEEIETPLKKWSIKDNGKFEVCKSLLEKNKAEGKKTIVFSGHPAILDELAKEFSSMKPYVLHAGTVVNKGESVSERNFAVTEAFKSDEKSWVLFANYQVLKTAVNLCQAPRQIYFDRSWEADIFQQAVKRSHRIGQTEKVIIQPLMFLDSLEVKEQHKEIEARIKFNDEAWVSPIEEINPQDDYPLSLEDCREIILGK